MKYIILVGDGMSDKVGDAKTPLELAYTPNLDFIAQHGICGTVRTIPADLPAGSDVAYLSILGYDPRKYYTGRAPLEAANLGIKLEPGEVAFRCNLVRIQNEMMVDYSAGHIKTQEAHKVIELLNESLEDENLKFYPGVSYRHILVIKAGPLNLVCTPPHDISGQKITSYLPSGEGQEYIRGLMQAAAEILKHKNFKANSIWLWGQGKLPVLPPFKVSGSVITAVDLIKGLGRLIGLEVINVPGATGYLDTNYKGKAEYALASLKTRDFVMIHVEAIDEASHLGDLNLKIKAIEDFDRLTVGTVLAGIDQFDAYKILLMPDHATPVSLKTHSHDAVPFAIYSKNQKGDEIQHFSEIEISKSTLKIEQGYKLIDKFIER